MDIKIYTCYHKSCPVLQNDVVIPILVGKAAGNRGDEGLFSVDDNQGESISDKNPFYCELTATYWIWKNIKADYVGLFHYRRYLNFVDDVTKEFAGTPDILQKYGISKPNLAKIFASYDVVVPRACDVKKAAPSLYEYYKSAHIASDMDKVLDIIGSLYPAQRQIAEKCWKEASTFYVCNIIIAKKQIFDEYARWLFSILFELEKQIGKDVPKRDSYQQRVYGFLAERMTGIFLAVHPELKIKELPLLFLSDNMDDVKKYHRKHRRRYLKRKILAAFGLRRNNG